MCIQILLLTTGRATRTLNAILRAATPSPCALPSGHPSGGTAQRAPSVSLAPSHFLSDYGSGAVAASRSAGCCRAHLVKTRQDKKNTSAPPSLSSHAPTHNLSLTHSLSPLPALPPYPSISLTHVQEVSERTTESLPPAVAVHTMKVTTAENGAQVHAHGTYAHTRARARTHTHT